MQFATHRGLVFAFALLAGAASAALAQTPAATVPMPASSTPAPSIKPLQIGDPAPALDVAAWVKGSSFKGFEKGTAYVVEFWATWCGPCRISIPKLTLLQERYPAKNVVVVGVSVDQGGIDVVRPFVEKMGDKMAYTVALDAGGTSASYMAATGRSGIPYAYVIDKEGKLAWHGHPADSLDLVVSEVAAGKFDNKKHLERQVKFHELDQKFMEAKNSKNWDEAMKVLDEISELRPDLAGNLLITRYWIQSGGKNDIPAAIAYARKLADNDLKNDPENLLVLADQVVGTPNLNPTDQEFATTLARRVVEINKGRNPNAFVILSEALKREGKFEEAIQISEKALAATDDPMEQKYYTSRIDDLKKERDAKKAEQNRSDKPPVDPTKP